MNNRGLPALLGTAFPAQEQVRVRVQVQVQVQYLKSVQAEGPYSIGMISQQHQLSSPRLTRPPAQALPPPC